MPSKITCYVCGQSYSFMGWAKHVGAEKKRYGDDIYIRLKMERNKNKNFIIDKNIKYKNVYNPNQNLTTYL